MDDASGETFQAIANRLNATGIKGSVEARKNARIARRILWLCRKAGWAPETTPASHQQVRDYFDANRPVTFRLTSGSYAVYRSEILSVLKPPPVRKGRYILQMEGIYREVHDLTVKSDMPAAFRWRCSPLLWYLHERGIMPPDITEGTVMAFYKFSRDVEQLAEDRARRRALDGARYISLLSARPEFESFGFNPVQIKFRNRSIKYDVPHDIADTLMKDFEDRVVPWSQGKVSNLGEPWCSYIERLDKSRSPASVSNKKSAWKARKEYQSRISGGEQVSRGPAHGFLPEGRRWAATTVKNRRDLCITCAKVLFETERYKLETIEELTDPELLEAIAVRLRERRTEKNPQSLYITNIITFVAGLAKDFVERSPEDLEKIASLKRKYGNSRRGIAPKNKEILRRFTSERIQKLIDIPGGIVLDVNRSVAARREAGRQKHGILPRPANVYDASLVQKVMLALAAHIMLTRAPRRKNLSGMRLDWIRWRDDLATVEIPPQFIKSRRSMDGPLLIPLDATASRLMDNYLKILRPKLLHPEDGQNPFLFPSPPHAGKQRIGGCYETLPDRLVDVVHERVGVRINPHLWRHLIGWIWLKEDPDKLPAVQKLLGHKSIQTTVDYYAEIDETVVLTEWMGFLDGKKA